MQTFAELVFNNYQITLITQTVALKTFLVIHSSF